MENEKRNGNEGLSEADRKRLNGLGKSEYIEKTMPKDYIGRVIKGSTSLDGDVENFYGVEGVPGTLGSIYKSDEEMGAEGKERFGKTPDELIKLLIPFVDGGVDVSKLEYGTVRSDYRKWNKGKGWKFPCVLFGSPSLLGGAIGIGVGIGSKFSESLSVSEGVLPVSIAATFIGATLVYSALRKPKGTNGEVVKELEKLKRAGRDATRFIRKEYRDYLVEKALGGRG